MAPPHSTDVLAGDRVACADCLRDLPFGGRHIKIGTHRRAAESRRSCRGHVDVRVLVFVHLRILSVDPDTCWLIRQSKPQGDHGADCRVPRLTSSLTDVANGASRRPQHQDNTRATLPIRGGTRLCSIVVSMPLGERPGDQIPIEGRI